MPPWTRGRPRLIYDADSGDLRCTACGACALACPVDVIKIEQHPAQGKGKILDRFDLDMGGCIECALCVEACPFRAIVMAPDFEFGDLRSRAVAGLQHARAAHRRDPRSRLGDGVHPGRQARSGWPGRAGRRRPRPPAAAPAGCRLPARLRPAAAAAPARRAGWRRGSLRPRPLAEPARPAGPGRCAGRCRQPRLAAAHVGAQQKAAAAKGGPLGFTDDLQDCSSQTGPKSTKSARRRLVSAGRPKE